MMKFTTKKLLLASILILILILININVLRSALKENLSHETKVFIKELFFGKTYMKEVFFYKSLNYNQKKLPQTLYERIFFKKIPLNNLDISSSSHYAKIKKLKINSKRFFLENFDNENIIYASFNGKIGVISLNNFNEKDPINTNLDKYQIHSLLDIKLVKDHIYVSLSYNDNDKKDCTYFLIAFAKMNTKFLNFQEFYKSNKCLSNTLGGRLINYKHMNVEGLLVSMGASGKEKELAQNDNSPYGKILFFDLDTKKHIIFSKGHRNPQGLIYSDGYIISTEHGPYGGDEINKILFKKNYGFPIASLGEPYKFAKKAENNREDFEFKKQHKKYNFEEPIFSFSQGIGISEIAKIPKQYSKYWINNYFITSLNGRSLYRVNFDDDFNKLNYMEKIYVGERIRDIIHVSSKNIFILALEETGSLGILSGPKSIN